MMFEMLLLFIIISIVLFFLIFILDDQWKICLPLIMINLILVTLVVYGFWDVEWLYLDATGTPYVYSTEDYSVYSYVFMGFWFMHILLFIKAGWHSWQEALETKGAFSYRMQAKENRRNRKWES